ncbi:MAG: glycosyltransferase family 1 protein [Clostridia bacterium]|nr:glycosyltransferase family 1 protein [Clostridia bacterium]
MADKIRVLVITGSLNIGGMEAVAMNIARYSDREKFQFDFLVYGDEEHAYEKEAKSLDCRVIHCPFPHKNPLATVGNIRHIIRNNGPYDIVHSHLLFNSGLAMKAAYKEHVPVRITHSHTNRVAPNPSKVRRIYESLMRRYIKAYATTWYACSEKAGQYLFGKTFLEKGHILRNGIYLSQYQIGQDVVEQYKADLRLDNCKVIGQVGSLVPVKNHTFSLQLFFELRKTRKDVKFLIIGGGELEESIRKQIYDMGLETAVLMLGKRSDIPELLNTIDVFLMPSFYEGVSVALMEAQAAGLPCVVSETAYAPEVRVTEQVSSLSLNADKDQWIAALLHAMDQERFTDSYKSISAKGYNIADIVAELNTDYLEYIKQERN